MPARRAPGDGSLYQRKDGRWAGSVRLSDGRRRTVYAKTRSEAREKLYALQREPEGKHATTLTLAAYLEECLRLVAEQRTAATLRANRLRLGHLPVTLTRKPLTHLKPGDVQAALARITREHSPASAQQARDALRTALRRAERLELIARDPVGRTDPVRHTAARGKGLTTAEARRLQAVADAAGCGALIAVALGLGLRSGELRGLAWSDIDWSAGTLRLHRQVGVEPVAGKGWQYAPLKTAGSAATLPLPRALLARLRRHHEEQAGPNPWGLVFPGPAGGPMYGAYLRALLRRLLAGAGLPVLRVHDLRHTAASVMLEQGVPAHVVRQVMRHTSLAMTVGVYTHTDIEQVRRGLTALDGVETA